MTIRIDNRAGQSAEGAWWRSHRNPRSSRQPRTKQRCREHEEHDKSRRSRRFQSTIEQDLAPKTDGGGATKNREAVASQGRSDGVVSTKNTTSPAERDDPNRGLASKAHGGAVEPLVFDEKEWTQPQWTQPQWTQPLEKVCRAG